MKAEPETKYCKECGDLLMDNGKFIKGYRGEKKKNRNILGKDNSVWVYWCMKCGDKSFCEMVNSHPMLKAKYYSIHGKSPEEQLTNIK